MLFGDREEEMNRNETQYLGGKNYNTVSSVICMLVVVGLLSIVFRSFISMLLVTSTL